MKDSLLTGFGIASGIAIYEAVVHGLAEVDWYRVIFIGVFSILAIALFTSVKRGVSK
ncbi:hypothetical protein [Marinimicrobium agarilyticum]|uniref:hypothetical protein n=1 Tax=Marinimicrobium agarilyticum TaxID=306546 RepID=UPI0012F66CAA|nr:hypothetical protein [Marinimicrobium agarilyticum]